MKTNKQSNEELFKKALAGDEKALVRLFNQAKNMWASLEKIPFDASGAFEYDDWQSIAKEAFFRSWKCFNPGKGVLFSTFIVGVVLNVWRMELRKIQAIKRDGELNKGDLSEYADILTDRYVMNIDVEAVAVFRNRFMEYLKKDTFSYKGKERFMMVAQTCFDQGSLSPTDISNLLEMPRSVVSMLILAMKTRLSEFIATEEAVLYGCEV